MATRLAALDIPPKPTQWVNDYGANLLSAADTQQLNEKLETLYKRTNTQFLVLIWPSLQGEEMLDFTNRVANVWKVKDDKALMLFVFVQDRKTFIQVGYGLEGVITDAYTSDVYRNTLVPNFRQGQYAAGINAAIDRLASKVDPTWTSTASTTAAAPVSRPVSRSTPGPSASDIVILVVLFLVFIFVIVPLLRRGGCGGCSGCIFPMFWGGGGWGGGGTTFGGGGGGGWSVGGSWGGGGSSFGGGGAGGSW
ncbi:MAG TPA: TPM domain-containing protein [Thermoanaerobaculia bacterium]|nr:TPM domain-containing protein [Thermoanaerobaculia bacterium]